MMIIICLKKQTISPCLSAPQFVVLWKTRMNTKKMKVQNLSQRIIGRDSCRNSISQNACMYAFVFMNINMF